jgi:hypothetical protein
MLILRGFLLLALIIDIQCGRTPNKHPQHNRIAEQGQGRA